MSNCRVCPFSCGVDRVSRFGRCRSSENIHIVRAAPHFWEEPCISGTNGSGTVFFSGCSLRCVFCQNSKISREDAGREFSVSEFADFLLVYSKSGVHNINLVTPTHFSDKIAEGLELVKDKLGIPVVWNCGGYEKKEMLKRLSGLVDIYLADAKFFSPEVSARYAACPDYFEVNAEALEEMFFQQPENIYSDDGIMQKGVIVRHLVLPSHTSDSRKLLSALKERFSENITLSLMCQYIPAGDAGKFPEINRRLRRKEFKTVTDFAESLGFENGYIQEFSSADDCFIPDFSENKIYGI